MRARLMALEALVVADGFWGDAQAATALMKEKSALELRLGQYDGLVGKLADSLMLVELGESEGDEASVAEGAAELAALVRVADKLEVQCLLGGETDGNNAFMEIHAGAGGTESCDWAAMLLRMYTRWAEREGLEVSVLEHQAGDQVGVKSAVVKLSGAFAFGLARTESGVHRLVRISPFDSNARRHTSFASVYVYPELDDTIEVEINPADLRVDTFRASGAGGQHVNKTDSAIRLTHLPTNTVVACQQDRSQHRNRELAMRMLRAKLYELERQKQVEAANKLAENKTEIGWGHQIRSYVLQPYQLVKDLRTGAETSNTTAVLDGDIGLFIKAALAEGGL